LPVYQTQVDYRALLLEEVVALKEHAFKLFAAPLLGIVAALFISLTACNAEILHQSAPVRIKDPWLKWDAAGQSGELYFYLTNQGEVDDALIAAASQAAESVEIYNTSAGKNLSEVEQVNRIDLPVKNGMIFLPGGPHITLRGLRNVTPGQLIPITLTFEQAGEFSFMVEAH